MIDRRSVLHRNPRVEFRLLAEGEGAVLLHLRTGAYHGVNEVGALVWDLLPDTTADDLLLRLRERLDDAPPSFDAEILGYLEELAERDLVIVDAPPQDADAGA